ncbi:MAG: serine hydrolase domain-containing protein [Promethearchaeota archaeon]
MTNSLKVNGFCDEKFERVKSAFVRNFKSGLEVGASFAATINGKFVIDMWAGHADVAQTRPWERDTIVNVYSTTKVMTVTCALMLVDRGLLDLDAPVAKYWPEFAQAGKENLPVRYLFSHTSGLSGFEEKIPAEALYDWDRIINLLAAQKPWWKPGTKSGYHSLTHGYLLGELIRRITGKTVGTFFQEEVAKPLNADFYIGLPEKLDSRVGELIPPEMPDLKKIFEQFDFDVSIAIKTLSNPPLNAELSKTRSWRGAEIPAANGHGNARSIARILSALACEGEIDNIRLLSLATIEKSIEEQSYKPDLVLMIPIRFGLGWGLISKEMPISPNPRTFYWGGWGGSVAVVDLDAKLSFSYVMNKMNSNLTGDIRTVRLFRALYKAL